MWLLVSVTSRRLALESWEHGGSIRTLFYMTTRISLLSEFSLVTTCSSGAHRYSSVQCVGVTDIRHI